ncbi:10020_t:CDS:2, partial [Acaulospora colombiana]
KVRLAHMLIASNRNNDAHALLKQALDAQVNNLNLRAYYTHFLLQSNLHQHALKFVHATLQMNKSDLYGACAAAWLHYQLAREIRSTNEEMIRDRRHKFRSAAEFYEKALSIDPGCAIAAQGLAIIVAEDALGVMSLKPAGAAVEDEDTRMRNTRDALDVFAKVREVIADGSLSKYYDNQNSSVLLCLARTWYAKGARDQSFASMKNALRIAQQAQQIVPADKAIRYNIAVIEQRAAELVFSLPVAKRTLEELQQALEHATHAQHFLFALSEDKHSGSLPYDRVMAEQRHMYGTALLRKGADQVAQQEKYEGEQKAKLEATRETRMAERAAAQAREREAEALAEERRKAREEAALWAAQHRDDSSEEEKPKRRKKEKSANDDLFDDDDAEIIAPKEPKEPREKKEKKPRVVRKRKGKDGQGGEEAHSSGAEDADKLERPKKRLTKKRVVNDEEEEEGEHRARKKFKSADVIDDSDEELERLDRLEEERLRLSKAVLTDGENEGKNSANEDVEMA